VDQSRALWTRIFTNYISYVGGSTPAGGTIKKGLSNLLKPFIFVVRQAGFEPRLKNGGISLTLNLPTWFKS
jgi:hypothetical protein